MKAALGLVWAASCGGSGVDGPGSAADSTGGDGRTVTGVADASDASDASDPTTGAVSTSTGSVDDTAASEGSSGTGGGPELGRHAAFLQYYAPIILKEAVEAGGDVGRDWLTNFDFDRDGWQLSNNRANWLDGRAAHVNGTGNADWEIRPTLYSAALEFDEAATQTMVLLYHVYHAEQGSPALKIIDPAAGSIHDWERIELRLDGVGDEPGAGEVVRYVVITEHSQHNGRGGETAQFHDTAQGRHILIWQAQHGNPLGVGFAELRYVEQSAESLLSAAQARVQVGGAPEQSYHYAFVDDADPDAVADWGAVALTAANAGQLAAAGGDPPAMADVRAIEYELQDLADVLASHWDDGAVNSSWTSPIVPILLEQPLADESGAQLVPEGMQQFWSQALDDLDDQEDRRGYPRKHWFWGAYSFDDVSFYGDAFDGAPAGTRCVANGYADCAGQYWAQHDYFLHDGADGDGNPDNEAGAWLPAGWHDAAAGGFDGRWVAIFPD